MAEKFTSFEQYIYPMAAATNGGESHSEFNIRQSLLNLLSHSAASSNDDFNIEHQEIVTTDGIESNTSFNLKIAITEGEGNCNGYFVKCGPFGTYKETGQNTGIFTDNCKKIPIDLSKYCDFYGENIESFVDSNNITYKLSTATLKFGLYLSIEYTQNMSDGLSYKILLNNVEYKFVCEGKDPIVKVLNEVSTKTAIETEYNTEFANYFEPQGFNDIGILIASGEIVYDAESGSFILPEQFFTKNENITRCIYLDRLGSQAGLVSDLSELLTRLRLLNIYGGKFYISDNVELYNGVHKDIGESGAREKFGADYRLQLSLSNTIEEAPEDLSEQVYKQIALTGKISLVSVSPDSTSNIIETDILNFRAKSISINNTEEIMLVDKIMILDDGQIVEQISKQEIVDKVDILKKYNLLH